MNMVPPLSLITCEKTAWHKQNVVRRISVNMPGIRGNKIKALIFCTLKEYIHFTLITKADPHAPVADFKGLSCSFPVGLVRHIHSHPCSNHRLNEQTVNWKNQPISNMAVQNQWCFISSKYVTGLFCNTNWEQYHWQYSTSNTLLQGDMHNLLKMLLIKKSYSCKN